MTLGDSVARSTPDLVSKIGTAPGAGLSRLDRNLLALVLLLLAGGYAVVSSHYYTGAEGLFDPTNHPIGRDFVNLWTAARLALDGQVLDIFDVAAFHAEQERLLGRSFPVHNWSYPPHTLFYVLPLGLLPYLWSYALWSAVTLGLYLAAALGRRWDGLPLLLLVLAPATFVNFATGQNGYLSAALLIGGLQLVDRRPVVAGILFGLLTFKPQLGLLVPVALVAARLWRPFLSAAATGAALAALSLAAFGPQAWHAYATEISPYQASFLNTGTGLFLYMMPTPFMALRGLGADLSIAAALQAVVTLAVVAGVYLAYRRAAARRLQNAVLLAGVCLATPYAFNYDMTVVSVAVLWALASGLERGFLRGEKLLLLLVWLLPITVMVLNGFGLPLAPVILLAFFGALLLRVRQPSPASG